MTHLPDCMDDVTLAWLQEAVKDHPAFHGARIAGSTRGARVGEGIGQMSDIALFDLAYDGKPGPARIVVKLHAPFQAMRDLGAQYEMFARETAFFNSFAGEVTVPLPDIYFAGWDPATKRNAIVLQDMSAWHWPDQLSGATLCQAERCIDALADLGARHWGADFSDRPWLPDMRSPVMQQVVGDYRLCTPVALERLADFVTPASRAACERILTNMSWICDALSEPPQILTHYDPRLENFVFSDESASELALIDWQLTARLRPGWDVAYFLGTSIPEAKRGVWQAGLCARYLTGLRAGGVSGYDESAFDYDFRLSTMGMTIIPVIGGATFDASNERSKDLFGTILKRSLASVLENDCLALLPA